MFQLFYVSDAVGETGRSALQSLLGQARDRNALLDITGMLLFRNGNFAQVLEGKEMAVRSLYSSISVDARHTRVTTVFTGNVPDREFPDWSMAYRDTSRDNAGIAGFSNFMNHAAEQTEQVSRGFPATSRHLLLTFRRALDSCPDDL